MKEKMERFLRLYQIRYAGRLAGIMLITSLFSFLLHGLGIGKENILMLFIVSVMVFNYLFTEPVRTFSISNQDDVILLIFFLVAALISSNLTVRFRNQVEVARKNEQLAEQLTMEQLAALSRAVTAEKEETQ